MSSARSIRRLWTWLLLGGLVLAHVGAAADPVEGAVTILRLDGSIQPASLRYLKRGLQVARERQSPLVVLELDTPGGLLVSLREMTTAVTQAETPVAVYVAPGGARAASAGFFLLLAADVAAMAPGTNTGAAHPVPVGQGGAAPKEIMEKIANDAAAFARALASQRGRPADWAERAVLESSSFTEREALKHGLIELVASSREELLAALDGRTIRRFDGRTEALALAAAPTELVELTLAERLLMLIADPNIAYLLLMAGLLGLSIELISPGLVVPGALGFVCLLLSAYALSVLPVTVVGLVLLGCALGLFIAEIFVPSYGLLSLGALVALVLGSMMLIDSPLPQARVSPWLVAPTAGVLACVAALFLIKILPARRQPPRGGLDALVGEVGDAVTPLRPEGHVFVHGEYWSARASRPVPKGAPVRVQRVVGTKLEVDPISAPPQTPQLDRRSP